MRALLAAAAAAVALLAVPAAAHAAPADGPAPVAARARHALPLGYRHEPTRPCRSEDSTPRHGCYWDAHRMGNRHGHSFNLYRRGRTVCWDYWTPRDARRLNGCEVIGR